jgi:hypothetical protein
LKKDRVEQYIARQGSPQREICAMLRRIILGTYPEIEEGMKMGVPWYGKSFYIVALKDHVNLGFSLTGLTKEQVMLFQGSGATMKHIEFRDVDGIDEEKIFKLMEMVRKGDKR